MEQHAIWFQKSNRPTIKASVSIVNDQYRWSIYSYREFGPYNTEALVMEGNKSTLSESKKEVFKVFENENQLEKLMSAKTITRALR